MIQVSKIQNALLGIVGFNQPYNPSYAIVDADNLLSESGYFVTDNPYAKIEYIKDNQDFLKITDTDFNLLLIVVIVLNVVVIWFELTSILDNVFNCMGNRI